MHLENSQYRKIKELFGENNVLLTQDFELSIKKSMGLLNFEYLLGSCREAQILLTKYPSKFTEVNLFNLILFVYNKRTRQHQAIFFLLHCFENALRSTLAIRIANHYNKKKRKDNWFKNLDKLEAKLLAQLIKERCKNIDIEKTNTFEIFECFYLGDLRKILQEYWNLFGDIFHDKKEYKSNIA